MIDSDIYVTPEQLARHVGRSLRQIRHHLSQGWLKATRKPGVQGVRISLTHANKWLALHYPQAGPMASAFQAAD